MSRDRISQSRLYETFAPKMLGVCLRYTENRQEAEEILHEGFLRVFKYIDTYRGEGCFEGWIRKIMVNCAINAFKRSIKLYPVSSIEDVELVDSDYEVFQKMERKELLVHVQNLPPAYRLVFNLYVFEGFKHREIAEVLKISEGTSKSNLYDARALLREAISKDKLYLKYK